MIERHIVTARRVSTPEKAPQGTLLQTETIYSSLPKIPNQPSILVQQSNRYFNEQPEAIHQDIFKKTDNELSWGHWYTGISTGAGIGTVGVAGLFVMERFAHISVEALSHITSVDQLGATIVLGIASFAWNNARQRSNTKAERMKIDLKAVENLIHEKEDPGVEIPLSLVRRVQKL